MSSSSPIAPWPCHRGRAYHRPPWLTTDFSWVRSSTPRTHERTGERVRLDPDDLTTHGVIVGMTGSGKTGLAIGLLEEALLAGIPVLAIDPKGDLANLALVFPALDAASFEPVGRARRRPGRGGRRRGRRASPGGGSAPSSCSASATPAPSPSTRRARPPACRSTSSARSSARPTAPTPETVAEEIEGTVSGLLGLVGIEADPLVDARAHPARQPRPPRLGGGRGHRPRHARRPGADAADPQARRARHRRRSSRRRHRKALATQAQRPAGVADGGGVVGRATPLDIDALLRPEGPDGRPGGRGRLPRPPRRRGAPVRRGPPARRAGHVDAAPARHRPAAGAPLLRRGDGLRAAGRQPAGEAADAAHPQAGPGLRRRRRARHPEPRRPRLQGASPTPAPGPSAGSRPSRTRAGCSTA